MSDLIAAAEDSIGARHSLQLSNLKSKRFAKEIAGGYQTIVRNIDPNLCTLEEESQVPNRWRITPAMLEADALLGVLGTNF